MAFPGRPFSDLTQAALFRHRQRRAEQRAAAVASAPATVDLGTVAATEPLGNSYTTLTRAYYGVSFSAPVAAGELTVATPRESLSTPALTADQIYLLGFVGPEVALTLTSAIAGTVSLWVLDHWRKPFILATGVFT